jgi:hypothetical protein
VRRRFVERRRRELRGEFPCAVPTNRTFCPRHGTRVGPYTRLCKRCFDQFYEQVAQEYLNAARKAA